MKGIVGCQLDNSNALKYMGAILRAKEVVIQEGNGPEGAYETLIAAMPVFS